MKFQYILLAIVVTIFLLFCYSKGSGQSITKTITPVICVKGADQILDSGTSVELSGYMKNERFLFSQMKWQKSFKGHFIMNDTKYTFDTFYVGKSTYDCFTGGLVWKEYGTEQYSTVTFNKDLEAFQFVKKDGRFTNGPSKDLEQFKQWFSYFTSTPQNR